MLAAKDAKKKKRGSDDLPQRREGAKVTGRCPSSRGDARVLGKISPFGRNDNVSELGVFAPLRENISFPA